MDWLLGVVQGGTSATTVAGLCVVQGDLLADGGFAYVYSGTDVQTGAKVAIRKTLLQDDESLQKARLEIALLKRLPPHPHVVRFIGAEIFPKASLADGVDGQRSCPLAVSLFELCTGGTLLAHLDKTVTSFQASHSENGGSNASLCCPCLSQSGVLDVLGGTAAALAHLHGVGIIHYDVKSENLLLGEDALWKLADFGSASERTFELTGAPRKQLLEAEEFVHGRCTPLYRAPEVADVYLRWTIGPKVDVFATGCVLYATMMGKHPFPVNSALANIQARFDIPAAAATAYAPELLQLLRDSLARAPADRPTAAELFAQVERLRMAGSTAGGICPAAPQAIAGCLEHIKDQPATAPTASSGCREPGPLDVKVGDVVLASFGGPGGHWCWARVARVHGKLCDVEWLRPRAGQQGDKRYVCLMDGCDDLDFREKLDVRTELCKPAPVAKRAEPMRAVATSFGTPVDVDAKLMCESAEQPKGLSDQPLSAVDSRAELAEPARLLDGAGAAGNLLTDQSRRDGFLPMPAVPAVAAAPVAAASVTSAEYARGEIVLARFGPSGDRFCWARILTYRQLRDGSRLYDVVWLRPQHAMADDWRYACVGGGDDTDHCEGLRAHDIRARDAGDAVPLAPPAQDAGSCTESIGAEHTGHTTSAATSSSGSPGSSSASAGQSSSSRPTPPCQPESATPGPGAAGISAVRIDVLDVVGVDHLRRCEESGAIRDLRVGIILSNRCVFVAPALVTGGSVRLSQSVEAAPMELAVVAYTEDAHGSSSVALLLTTTMLPLKTMLMESSSAVDAQGVPLAVWQGWVPLVPSARSPVNASDCREMRIDITALFEVNDAAGAKSDVGAVGDEQSINTATETCGTSHATVAADEAVVLDGGVQSPCATHPEPPQADPRQAAETSALPSLSGLATGHESATSGSDEATQRTRPPGGQTTYTWAGEPITWPWFADASSTPVLDAPEMPPLHGELQRGNLGPSILHPACKIIA